MLPGRKLPPSKSSLGHSELLGQVLEPEGKYRTQGEPRALAAWGTAHLFGAEASPVEA